LHKPKAFNDNSLYNLRFYNGSGIIFESLSTIGILGTIGLLLIILTFLSVIVYLLSRDKEKNKIYSLGFVSAALIFLINALGDQNEWSDFACRRAFEHFGDGDSFERKLNRKKRVFNLSLKASPNLPHPGFYLYGSGNRRCFPVCFYRQGFYCDMYVGSANREATISENGSVAKVLKGINLYGKEGRYYSRLAQEYMALVNQEIAKGENDRDLNKVQVYLNNSIAAANMGKDLMKQDVLASEVSAQVYESAGVYVPDSLPLTEAAYKRAQELEPENPNFYLKLGQIKEASGGN